MAKRRTAGEGTINQLPSGSWRAQVSLRGRRLSYTGKSQQAARDWIRKIQAQIEQGLTYDDSHATVGIFMEGWLATKKLQLRISSAEQYTRICRVFIEPNLGSQRLKNLSPGKVQEFYDRLGNLGTGIRTIRLVHVLLHMCLEHAKNLGLIGNNPAQHCKVAKGQKVEMKIWDEDQVNKFLDFIRGHKNENLYHLALATGMRRGELLGLQWKDVDWVKQRIMVRRQCFNPEGGGYIFQPPKTDLGLRSVRLGLGTIECLRRQLKNIDLMRQFSREKWEEHDLVFPAINGKPLFGNNITQEFQQLLKQAGLPKIRFHDCRHTAASIMLGYGISPTIVAGMLGHSIATLLNTYTHFIPDMQDEAARIMDEVTSSIAVDLNHRG
ncbi:MAG: hypothetical protein A2Y88_04935 [Chloroflexi bacterium RBG_13_48_10]|nr:MAG: hypothetical protein A2Y88_04935 [Chloroflexi bacterium RBG_13_48_10]